MNKNVSALLTFAGGAGIGSLVTWIFLKNKYQKLVDQAVAKIHETVDIPAPKDEDSEPQKPAEPEVSVVEVEDKAVQAVHASKIEEKHNLQNDFQKQAAMIAREKPNIIDYTNMIKELNYKPDVSDEYVSDYPYLITKEMTPFGEKEDSEGNPYDKITLIYYEDGVIADTTDEIIDDVNGTIGTESLTHFGDFPDKDSVFVRNDRLKADFEVCMSNLSWEDDVLVRKPYLRGQ